IQKFFKEICLVEQPYVKDGDLTVAKFLENVSKEIGTDIEVVKFARLEKGEGLEKKVDDFAAEVAKMAGN
ncbi:MAG: elongation factor Ts, partial [Clostridia bacterium]|nr:elongation factor Ts [Clostridia bacterium]